MENKLVPPKLQFPRPTNRSATIACLVIALGFGYAAYSEFSTGGSVAGTIFAFVGLCFLFAAFSKLPSDGTAEIANLIKTGKKIFTEFKAIDRKWNEQANYQSAIIIYTQDANSKTYQSEELWFQGGDAQWYNDPRFKAWQRLQALNITNEKCIIPVYVNTTNPDDYYMDLSNIEISNR